MSEVKKIQPYKTEAVSLIRGRFESAKDFIFTDYRGLTVAQISILRRQLREAGAEYKVMKNAYAKIVLHEMKHTTADAHLVGPTAIAYTAAEPGPVAKILFAAMKDTPLQVKGALIGGELFGKEQTEAYSKLPTRLEMISILMNTMNGVTSKLVRTLAAVADQKAGN